MNKITNTTVYNTDDVMSYVSLFHDDVAEIKIRYLNKPIRPWPRSETPTWVRITKDYRTSRLDVALLRYNQVIDKVPVMALAYAANDESITPPKLRQDLIEALNDYSFNPRAREKVSTILTPIRVADRADRKDCQRNALLNLRKKVKAKKRSLRSDEVALLRMKEQIKKLESKIPEFENEYLPAAAAELAKLEVRLAKREKSAKDSGLVI